MKVTTANPDALKFLREIALCDEADLDNRVLVFADWLEEQQDARAGKLRELVRDLHEYVFANREIADRGADQIRAEMVHLALTHGCAYVDQIGDPHNRCQRFVFPRKRDAALRRFSVVAEQERDRTPHAWFIEQPECDLVEWNAEALKKHSLEPLLFGQPVEVDRPKRSLVRLFPHDPKATAEPRTVLR